MPVLCVQAVCASTKPLGTNCGEVNGGYHVDTLYVGRFTGASLVPCGIDVKGHIPVVNDLELGSIS